MRLPSGLSPSSSETDAATSMSLFTNEELLLISTVKRPASACITVASVLVVVSYISHPSSAESIVDIVVDRRGEEKGMIALFVGDGRDSSKKSAEKSIQSKLNFCCFSGGGGGGGGDDVHWVTSTVLTARKFSNDGAGVVNGILLWSTATGVSFRRFCSGSGSPSKYF